MTDENIDVPAVPSKLNETDLRRMIALLEKGEPLPVDLLCQLLPPDLALPILVYSGKHRRDEVLSDTQAADLKPVCSYGEAEDSTWSNMLIHGDNLPVLKTLLEMRQRGELKNEDGSDGVRLIYIDPPFATGQTFLTRGGQMAYNDKQNGIDYIEFLRERLILASELLDESGTIYVHLDPRMSSYIRVVMDEIYGTQNFFNELAWVYRGREASKVHWNPKHDNILVYAKCRGRQVFNWSAVLENYSPVTLTKFRYEDERGLFQVRGKARADSPVNQSDGLTLEDEIRYPGLTYRQYLGEGVLPRDWWEIPSINKAAREKTGYPTQKPEALLARIISASSRPGDLILDFFAGSGTTLAVAEKLGRRWIGIDQSEIAIDVIGARLLDLREEIGNKGKRISPRPFIVYSHE